MHKLNAVAELGMTGDDASVDEYGMAVEPESGSNTDVDCQGHDHLDVTAAAAEVGGLQAHGDLVALLVDFDLDLQRIARMAAAIGFGWRAGRGLGVGRIHGLTRGWLIAGLLE